MVVSRLPFLAALVVFVLVVEVSAAGVWSDRGIDPGNPRLAELDSAKARARYAGGTRAELESTLGRKGRRILVPTADGGWIEWDDGVPPGEQTWVYSLRRSESRGPRLSEFRREDRRLVLGLDDSGKVVSVGWSCDTSAWRKKEPGSR